MSTLSKQNILVVEDEVKIDHLVRDYLQRDGFSVTLAHDGRGVPEQVDSLEPTLVILDWMLPGQDGLTICRAVRRCSSVPVIMLTARIDEDDRLEGFQAGADDYVCKPFSPLELVARVRSILRRSGGVAATHETPTPGEDEERIVYREVVLDESGFSCTVRGDAIKLTPIEFRMLREMLRRPGRAYSRYQLMRAMYDDHRVVSDRTIDSHVSHLRRKLAVPLDGEELVHAAYGVGYRVE